MDVVGEAKKHPVLAGITVFVGGYILLKTLGLFGASGGSSSGGSDPNVAAYYAAESAQAQSGNALQAVQIQTAAQTAQTLIGANASVVNNATWASTDLATTKANDAAAQAIAPYNVQNNLISTLGQVASVPGGTSTTTSSTGGTSGFFGIGATPSQSSTSSVYVPNPAAVDASGLLSSLVTNGLIAGH